MTPSAYPPNAPPGSAPYPTTQGTPPPYPGGPNTGTNAAPGYPTHTYPLTQGQEYPYPPPQVSLEFHLSCLQRISRVYDLIMCILLLAIWEMF